MLYYFVIEFVVGFCYHPPIAEIKDLACFLVGIKYY